MDKKITKRFVIFAASIAVLCAIAVIPSAKRHTDIPSGSISSDAAPSSRESAEAPTPSRTIQSDSSDEASSATIDSSSELSTEDDMPPSPEPQYIKVKKSDSRNEHALFHSFYEYGIPCEIVYSDDDKVPYGDVISIDYKGNEDADHYYIAEGSSVTLNISGANEKGGAAKNINKVFYLTFDDGPSKNTPKVIDILKKYNISATFFTIGESSALYPDKLKLIHDAGHLVACHSYSHEYYQIYSSADALSLDIDQWESVTKNILGELPRSKIFRFPGGSNTRYIKGNGAELLSMLRQRAYRSFDWNLGNNDAWLAGMSEEQTIEDYLKWSFDVTLASAERSRLYRICLLHETSDATIAMLEDMIVSAIEKGYVFRTVDLIEYDVLFS